MIDQCYHLVPIAVVVATVRELNENSEEERWRGDDMKKRMKPQQ
jgi:hypothetical protein